MTASLREAETRQVKALIAALGLPPSTPSGDPRIPGRLRVARACNADRWSVARRNLTVADALAAASNGQA